MNVKLSRWHIEQSLLTLLRLYSVLLLHLYGESKFDLVFTTKSTKNSLGNPGILLTIISFITAVLVQTGDLGSIDTARRLQVTHSFWTKAPPVKVGDYPEFGIVGRGGEIQAWYGMGQSLVMLPSDIIATKLTEQLKLSEMVAEKLRVALICYMTFPLISSLAILFGFNFLKILNFTQKESIAGSLGLLFGSSFLACTQINQENSLLLLLTLSGYYLNSYWLITGLKRALFWGTCALSFNFLVRLTTFIDIFSVSIFVFSSLLLKNRLGILNKPLKRYISEYCLVAIPVYVFFLLIERMYQWIRFGTIWGTYFSIIEDQYLPQKLHQISPELFKNLLFIHFSQNFSQLPFINNCLNILFSPEASILLFDSLIIVFATLIIKFWYQTPYFTKLLIASLIFLLLSYIVFYANFPFWKGSSFWGSRYTTTPTQLISMLSIPLFMQFKNFFRTRLVKLFGCIFIFYTVIVQISSVIFWYNLEGVQASFFGKPTFIIGLRFKNILAVALNKFDDWGLSFPEYTDRFTTLNFTPFLTYNYLSPQAYLLAQTVWWATLVFLIILVAFLIKKTFSNHLQ